MNAGKRNEALKASIAELLADGNLKSIEDLWREQGSTLRILISMTYDKSDPKSWRAMEAIGRIAAMMDPDSARGIIQRLLWMMREESGTNPWSAGEILGEILAANPGPFEDIVPIVISFHDEPMLRTGALWTMYRVATKRPDLVGPFVGIAVEYLGSDDPKERGFALLALLALGVNGHRDDIRARLQDEGSFIYYQDGELVTAEVGSLAKEALSKRS